MYCAPQGPILKGFQLDKEREKDLRAKEKAEEEKRKAHDAALLKPALAPQKVPFGVDPKTIVCQYFKLGSCDKGKKCRFRYVSRPSSWIVTLKAAFKS